MPTKKHRTPIAALAKRKELLLAKRKELFEEKQRALKFKETITNNHTIKMIATEIALLSALMNYNYHTKTNSPTSDIAIDIAMRYKQLNKTRTELLSQEAIQFVDSIENDFNDCYKNNSEQDIRNLQCWLKTFKDSHEVIQLGQTDMFAQLTKNNDALFACFQAIVGEDEVKNIRNIHEDFQKIINFGEQHKKIWQLDADQLKQSRYGFFLWKKNPTVLDKVVKKVRFELPEQGM